MMKVIFPAAGKGTRLYPLTSIIPKPLIPVAGKPLIAHLLDRCISAFPDVEPIVIVGYKAAQVERFLSASYDVPIRYIEQSEQLGLGHAVSLVNPFIGNEPVLILNTDGLIDVDLQAVVRRRFPTIGVCPVANPESYGVVETEGDRIVSFIEKPTHPKSHLVMAGLYFFPNGRLLMDALSAGIRLGERENGEYPLTPALSCLLAHGVCMQTVQMGWQDCGTFAGIQKAWEQCYERIGNC